MSAVLRELLLIGLFGCLVCPQTWCLDRDRSIEQRTARRVRERNLLAIGHRLQACSQYGQRFAMSQALLVVGKTVVDQFIHGPGT